MAYNGSQNSLPAVKPRIIGGRMVTDVDLPPQFQGLAKSIDKVNHYNPTEWEKQFQAALRASSASAPNRTSNGANSGPVRNSQPAAEENSVVEIYSRMQNEAKSGNLPRKPLELSEAQQTALIYEIDQALNQRTSLETLKHCYLEMAKYDRDLSSTVSYGDLAAVLEKHKVTLPTSLLRLIASLFVVPQANGESKVNYEKLLSFMGACFRRLLESQGPSEPVSVAKYQEQATSRFLNERDHEIEREHAARFYESDQPQSTGRPGHQYQQNNGISNPNDNYQQSKVLYYEPTGNTTFRIPAVGVERDLSRTKRLAEEYLRRSRRKVRPSDLEALRRSFLHADRLVRRTLSEIHIKDICRHHQFPLPDFVLEEIIRTCSTHRGGGQYDWEEFVDFLEKLQATNTGLLISDNPQPVAQRPPSPVASWPHAESPVPFESTGEAQYRSEYGPEPVILFARNHLTPVRGAEWVQKFERFVYALFEADETQSGTLRPIEAMQHTKRLNHSLRLFFTEMQIDEALRQSRIADGQIDLSTYLRKLARPESNSGLPTATARNSYY